ncbi:hypothetical protein [Kineothrix sedimenti]|uniref:DUF4268 domain-containing protein n=1 Tax=Kineothrix sedimenti TaxID=3123317 RepID=A0ABZ3F074_9FIRM
MKIGTGLYINEKELIENELDIFKAKIIKDYQYLYDVKFKWKVDRVLCNYTKRGWSMDKDEEVCVEIILTEDQIKIIESFNTIINHYKRKEF